MKAIFVSGIDYESPIQIGDHHLARQFASAGWDVAYISLPVTPFHLLSKNKSIIKRRFRNFVKGGIKYQYGNGSIWSYVPASLTIPKNNPLIGARIYQNWHKSLFPQFRKLLIQNNFDNVDLVYIRDPLQAYILNFVHGHYSIFRMADNDAGFDSYNKNYENALSELVKKVNLVLYSAISLKDRVNSLDPNNSMFLPNGVDLRHFQKPKDQKPHEFQTISKPIVVYAGSIDFWFDFDLINHLSQNLPEISFVIIGPNEEYAQKFIPNDNLYLLGPIPYEKIPDYLASATLGIIPFNRIQYPELVNAINPLKLFEYLACDLPVISSRWNEIEMLNSPAILCDTYEDFIFAIRKSINLPVNISIYQAFLEKYDWNYLFRQLLGNIESKLE
jgi:glycosyltransferase involved in cell wall biosynthesis